MNNSTHIRYPSLALAVAAIPLNIFLGRHQAAIAAPLLAQTTLPIQTVILCETADTTVRIYKEGNDKEGNDTVMRTYSRTQNAVFMNGTPVDIGELPNGTSYRNSMGELSVIILASQSDDECSIEINGQSEDGRLLVDNRVSPINIPETPAADAAVTGTLSYRARIRLPPNAVIITQLIDLTSGQAVSEQTMTTTGEQVPIPFALSYNPSDIISGHRYEVQANILIDNELRWTTADSYPVITQRSPLTADVVLVMADSAKSPKIQPVPGPGEGSDLLTGDLPMTVEQAVQAALMSEIGETEISETALEIGSYSRETWTDGCLGLAQADELCLAALTEGWQVEVFDQTTEQRYVYRTNLDGSMVRQETSE